MGMGGGIVATNGGTGVNEGVIDAIGTEMIAYQDSTIVNDGTLFVWDNNDKCCSRQRGWLPVVMVLQPLIMVLLMFSQLKCFRSRGD